MAEDNLQTRCPACQTVFAVDSSVLKQAGGRVRCGECLHVFDALSNVDEDIPVLVSKPALKPSPVIDDIVDIGGNDANDGDAVIDFADTFLPTEFDTAGATNESSIAENALSDVFDDSVTQAPATLDLDVGEPALTTDTPADATRLLADTSPGDVAPDALDLDFGTASARDKDALDFDLDDGLFDGPDTSEPDDGALSTDALDFDIDPSRSAHADEVRETDDPLFVAEDDHPAQQSVEETPAATDEIDNRSAPAGIAVESPVDEDRPTADSVPDTTPFEAAPVEPEVQELEDPEPEVSDSEIGSIDAIVDGPDEAAASDEAGLDIDMQDLTAAFGGDVPAEEDASDYAAVESPADSNEAPVTDDGLRDGTGRFLFSDDTPPEELEAELQALANDDNASQAPVAPSEPTAIALDLGESETGPADPESLIQTLSGEDWDDLLDELGEESDESGERSLDFELVDDDTSTSSVDLDLTRADDALTTTDDNSAEAVPAAAEPTDAEATPDDTSAAPSIAPDDSVEPPVLAEESQAAEAVADLATLKATNENPGEPPATADDDKTTFMASPVDNNGADSDKTAFLETNDSAEEDKTAFLTSGPSAQSADDEIFDINALTSMLRASEVFLDEDDNQEAPAALPEEQQEILLKEELDAAPSSNLESDDDDLAEDDDKTALMTPADPFARAGASEEQQVIEEIVLSSDEPPAIQETPEDMFAQSMIMAVPEQPRRRGLWAALSVLLVIALGGQLVHQYRGQLLTMDPWGAYLGKVYALFGLDAEPVWDINALCVQRSGSTLTERTLDIETLFQNQTKGPVPLPTIKVDITDNFDDVIATALVGPADYLPNGQSTSSTLAAAARQTAYLSLDFAESRADKFELSLCYDGDDGTLRCGAAICGTGR